MKPENYVMSPWTEWGINTARKIEEHKEKRRAKIKEMLSPPEYFPITADERAACRALVKCRYLPGSFEKRFARDMASIADQAQAEITEKQRAWLWKQVYRYRKQLGENTAIVQLAKEKL